jgi:hypothetical protein
MAESYFSKQTPSECASRLSLLANSRGFITIWLKGKQEKYTYLVQKFDKDRMEIVLDTKEQKFKANEKVLCTFILRGMSFFAEVHFQVSISEFCVLKFEKPLYKSERRSSYRLLAYPLYEIWAEFHLDKAYEDGKVIDFKTKISQTALFKSFLKIVGDKGNEGILKLRIQDLSVSGMAIHVGPIEVEYFQKDLIFENIDLKFKDLTVTIPKVKIIYVVDYISGEKGPKKYKLGIHFENLPPSIDDLLGKKINELLRENDMNSDFENFLK